MPQAPSAQQSEASRRNCLPSGGRSADPGGALSRGPVTDAGKAASSQNALRHGLRGGGISVRSEECDWYADLLATHLELYVPANEAEKSVVEQLCIVELKLHRLDLLELAALEPAAEDETERGPRPPSLATLARYRNRIVKERWELEHRLSQLQHRRKSLGADAAGARQELRDEARARALGSIAMMGVLGSGLLAATNENGTNGPEPANRQKDTNGPEPRGTNRQKSTDEPEAGGTSALNRRQRRLMEKLARRKAAQAQMARAA